MSNHAKLGISRIHRWSLHAALCLLAALSLAPLLWMVSLSLMPAGQASQFPPPLLPETWTLANYQTLFSRLNFGTYLLNSILISTIVTLVSLFINTMAGYAFAKLQFRGRERIFKLLLAALVVPAQVAMLPLFLLLKQMGLVNTYWGVMLPAMASIFGIFLVRQYARSIPDALLESARIDGASEWRIFFQIVMPLMKPVVVTLAIITFMGSWNDFMWPLIILTDSSQSTLPIALASLSREYVQDVEMMMAGAVLTVAPVLVLFVLLQRYYIQGLLLGGVKG